MDDDDFDDFMDEDDAPASPPAVMPDDEDDDTDDDLDDLDGPSAAPAATPAADDDFDDFDDDDFLDGINLTSVPQPVNQAAATDADLDDFDDFDSSPSPPPSSTTENKVLDPPQGDAFAGKPFTTEVAVATGGLGMSITGPAPQDRVMTGCFVAKVKELSPAYANGKIKPGMWIIEINGTSCAAFTKSQTAQLVKNAKGKVKLKLQFCPRAFGHYDQGRLLAFVQNQAANGGKKNKVDTIPSEQQERWFVGRQNRDACHEAVLSGSVGDFVVREGTKPGTAVVVVNDSGLIANMQVTINKGNGQCTFGGKNFGSLDDVIDFLRVNPQTSKKEGCPQYVLKYPPMVALKVSTYWDFMAWSQGQLRVRSLPAAKSATSAAAVDVKSSGKVMKTQESKDKSKSSRWSLRRSSKSTSPVKEQPKVAEVEFSFPVIRVAIAKRDAPSFGMTFIGPDANGPRRGVYISKVRDDGPAAQEKDDDGSTKIKPGMRILGMNGKSVQEASKTEAVDLLKQGSLTAVMTLQMDPIGYSYYDKGALLDSLRKAKESPISEEATQN